MTQVDDVFPLEVGAEIDTTLRTLKDLPEHARGAINDHLKDLIATKRAALSAIMDQPGNAKAYFHIGMLFVWDTARVSVAGTLPERMGSLNTVYQTPEGARTVGTAQIGVYYLQKYLDSGDGDPRYVTIARQFTVSSSQNR